MAIKRIKKEQVDAGRKELPRKLAFLAEGKIDYLSVGHDEATDEWTLELPLASAKKLARSAADLKVLKAGQKQLAADAAQVPALLKDQEQLTQLRETAAANDAELKKAQRRVKALEKELGLDPGGKLTKQKDHKAPVESADSAPPAVEKAAPKAKPVAKSADSVTEAPQAADDAAATAPAEKESPAPVAASDADPA